MTVENKYEVIIFWSDEDQAFVADVPELPGCMAHGGSHQAALENAQEAIVLWLDSARARTVRSTTQRPPSRIRVVPSNKLQEPTRRRTPPRRLRASFCGKVACIATGTWRRRAAQRQCRWVAQKLALGGTHA